MLHKAILRSGWWLRARIGQIHVLENGLAGNELKLLQCLDMTILHTHHTHTHRQPLDIYSLH